MPESGEGPPIQSNAEINKPVEGKIARFTKSALRKLRFQKPASSSEGQIEYQRPTYKETRENISAVSERVSAMTTDEIRLYARENLPERLADIASSQMPLAEIPKTYYIIDAAIDEFTRRNVSLEDPDLKKLRAAKGLIYAVVMTEKLSGKDMSRFLPPPDRRGLVENRDNLIWTNVDRTATLIKNFPEMYGEKTREIYEGIVERLKSKREMIVMGNYYRSREFPPFPQPAQAEEQLSPEALSHFMPELLDLFRNKFDNSQIKQHSVDHSNVDRRVFGLHAGDFPYKSYYLTLSDGTSWGVFDPEREPHEYRISKVTGDVSEIIGLPKDERHYVEYEFYDVDSLNNPQRLARLSKVRRSRNTQFALDKAREIINSMPQVERS